MRLGRWYQVLTKNKETYDVPMKNPPEEADEDEFRTRATLTDKQDELINKNPKL